MGGGETFHRSHRNRDGPIRGLAKVGRSGIGAEVRGEASVSGERNGLVRRFHRQCLRRTGRLSIGIFYL